MKEYNILVFGESTYCNEDCEIYKFNSNFNLLGVVIGDENPNDNDPWTDELCLGNMLELTILKIGIR